jgi:hypothetical protein
MDVLQHGKFIEPNHPHPTKQESFRFFKIQIKKGKLMNKLHTAKKWCRHHGRPCSATLKKRWIGEAWRWERLDVVVLPAAQQQRRGHRIRRSRLPLISRRGQRFLMAVIYGASEWKRRGIGWSQRDEERERQGIGCVGQRGSVHVHLGHYMEKKVDKCRLFCVNCSYTNFDMPVAVG